MTLTPAQLSEYQLLLGEVNRLAQEDLVALWRSLEHLDKDALWESLRIGVPEIVALYRATAADTALLFYSETQGLKFDPAEGLAASQVNRAQVESSLRWAVFGEGNVETLGLISGIVQKHVVDGSRQYSMNGFQRGGDKWWRAARPGACEFCRMLATRAATDWLPYSSAEAAVTVGRGKQSATGKQPAGALFHNHCMCIPVKAAEYDPPSYVEKWKSDYYKSVEVVGDAFDYRSILAEMRKIG